MFRNSSTWFPGANYFRLGPLGNNQTASCDERGAFLGPVPLLIKIVDEEAEGHWVPRPIGELNDALTQVYGVPIDCASRARSLDRLARALNRNDVALAQIILLQMRLPELPPVAKNEQPDEGRRALAALLFRNDLLKDERFEEEHPRKPAGSPNSEGGEFVSADENGARETNEPRLRIDIHPLKPPEDVEEPEDGDEDEPEAQAQRKRAMARLAVGANTPIRSGRPRSVGRCCKTRSGTMARKSSRSPCWRSL